MTTDTAAILDRLTTEADLQRQVEELAGVTGWLYFHPHRSDHSVAGFPDLVLVRPPRILFIELKKEKGKRTPAQDVWAKALEEVAYTVGVIQYKLWRPSDWPEIEATLR